MLAKFLKARRSPAALPSVPPGQRIYAIGDVHGCLEQLDALLAMIEADEARREPAETTLVFLGDLIDRGPASAQVVGRVRSLAATRAVRCLIGNHEEVFLGVLDGDPKALRLFCRIGGRETALSYGIAPDAFERSSYEDLAALLAAAVSPEHRALLAGASDMEVIGDFAFVHAGVRPGRSLEEQSAGDLRWIRDPFLHHDKRLEKMVVHGHTIADAVEFRPHRIGVDTGAYLSGRLSAVGFEADANWVISTG